MPGSKCSAPRRSRVERFFGRLVQGERNSAIYVSGLPVPAPNLLGAGPEGNSGLAQTPAFGSL